VSIRHARHASNIQKNDHKRIPQSIASYGNTFFLYVIIHALLTISSIETTSMMLKNTVLIQKYCNHWSSISIVLRRKKVLKYCLFMSHAMTHSIMTPGVILVGAYEFAISIIDQIPQIHKIDLRIFLTDIRYTL
jgi:non-ribosomal peptide synthetase component E (peptide arylation enzyme)